MQNIQTWTKTPVWDPANPNQQPTQFWSPGDMGYRSAYWNEQPTTVQNLMGVLPDNRYAQIGIIAGLAAAAYFTFKKLDSKGLMGLGESNRQRFHKMRFKYAAKMCRGKPDFRDCMKRKLANKAG